MRENMPCWWRCGRGLGQEGHEDEKRAHVRSARPVQPRLRGNDYYGKKMKGLPVNDRCSAHVHFMSMIVSFQCCGHQGRRRLMLARACKWT